MGKHLMAARTAILDNGTEAACAAMLREGVMKLTEVKELTAAEAKAIGTANALRAELGMPAVGR